MRLLPERGTRNVNKNILKSIVAVFAGAVASIILSVGTDALMHATGIFPAGTEPMNDALFALPTMYRTIYGVVGAHITARLAPDRPMMYALVLGAFGVVARTAGAIAMWSKLPALGPKSTPAHRAGTAARIGRRITSLAAIGRADRDLISCTGSKSDSGATELLPSDFVGYRILPLEIA